MRYFTVAACLCDNPRRILLLRRFLTALLPLVLFAFFLFPGTTWAGAGSPDIFRTLRSTLHPAIIIAAFLYLGLRVIQPLHMSRPAKAALLLAAALLLGRVYMARAIFLLWHCEIIRPVYIAWSILQLALILFIVLHAVLTVLSSLYRRLRRINASPYMFHMALPGMTLFGSSPEVMVRCTAGTLQLSPIAGTRRRGRDDLEDARLAAELRADPKEQAEHVMLVDLGRNDLGRVARPGSVRVERYMDVERFSHVMHLTSSVTARLADGLDAVDVLASAFPAGTVSGAPKLRAMEIIRSVEGRGRGPYAGCIGWIGLDHESVNLDMGIAIRSMWHKEGTLFWQAGGGIVHDSDPELEWKEVCNKSAVMRLALEGEDPHHVFAHR